ADELFPPGLGQPIEARAAIVPRRSPFRVDEASLLEPLQRGIERSMFDDENVVGLGLDGARDALAVLGAVQECPQNQKVERSLQMSRVLAVRALSDRHSTQECLDSGRMSTQMARDAA